MSDETKRDNTDKQRQESPTHIQRIDQQLRIHYAKNGAPDYCNDGTSLGRFAKWCEDNGFDDDTIKEEFDGDVEDSVLIEFDPLFPFDNPTMSKSRKNEKIFNILKNIYLNNSIPKSNYFPKGGYSTIEHKLEPIARALLTGVYDDNHPLSIFRGMRYIIKKIWLLAMQFNRMVYSSNIETAIPEYLSKLYWSRKEYIAFGEIDTFQSQGRCGTPQKLRLQFPEPLEKEININMMPILMDEKKLKKQLGTKLEGYAKWINACLLTNEWKRLKGKICYVTIHESFVEKGKTQRRPGLHIENPGKNGYGVFGEVNVAWGGGYNYSDGIFMASNVSGSCAAWNCRILDDKGLAERRQNARNRYTWLDWDEYDHDKKETVREENEQVTVIDNLGNIEHLRGVLPKDRKCELEAGKLYWFTDRTPHEALPMQNDGWRQFFRLVSNKLSVWYEDHSTKNPLGIVPDGSVTKIIKGNKFLNK